MGPSPLDFFVSSVSVWAAFPQPLARLRIPTASDYYAPSDSLEGHWDFVLGCPFSTSHLPCHSFKSLPCSWHRTQSRMLEVACFFMPLPRSVAPQSAHRVGQVYRCCRAHASSLHVFWSYFRQQARRFRCDWLTCQARYVRVVLTRRAIHASYESPWHSLAKHHLLEACFLLMAPFRSMLLTLRGGSESLAPTAHWIPVYPMVFSTFLCRAFTAHEAVAPEHPCGAPLTHPVLQVQIAPR